MCDERERLIGYIYDECDAAERRTVEGHLESCSTCRSEVHALRGVRADLLAWNVPGSPETWRPFPAPVTQIWWRQVPGWALAAAAGLVLAAGITGGVTARAGSPAPPVAAMNQPAVQAVGITAAELAAAQERILDLVRIELDQRAQPAGTTQSVRYLRSANDDQLTRQITDLSNGNNENLAVIATLYTELQGYRDKTDAKFKQLQHALDTLTLAVQQGR